MVERAVEGISMLEPDTFFPGQKHVDTNQSTWPLNLVGFVDDVNARSCFRNET